jgi:hypothetical protein
VPFPNEHSARVNDPGKYDKIRRENDKFGSGIHVIWGVAGEGKAEVQAIRFSKDKFTAEEAKAWLKDHEHSYKSFEAASTKDGADRVIRFDVSPIKNTYKTKEGFLRSDAVVTRTGIFIYHNADGSMRREFRDHREVFDGESLESMKMIPLTNDHPSTDTGLLDPSNTKQFQVGFTGENVRADGENVKIPVTITDGEAIENVENGKRALSLGYECDLIEKAGDFEGMHFDCKQSNIRYNHLAIVDCARAGGTARINLDSAMVDEVEHTNKKEAVMPKVKLDGIEYDAAQEVVNFLTKETARANKADGEVKTEMAEHDKTKAERDTLKFRVDTLEKRDLATEIKTGVATRLNIERKSAIILDGEDISTKTDEEIRKAVVLKVFPEAKLEGVSTDYLIARFDSAIEIFAKEKGDSAMADQRKKSVAVHTDKGGTNEPVNVEKSEEDYKKRIQSAYKSKSAKNGDDDDEENLDWGSKKAKK